MRLRRRFRRTLPNLFSALGSAVLVVGTVFVALAPTASANTSAYTANDYFGTAGQITGTLYGKATQNPTTGAFAGCNNGKVTATNCNIYSNKNGVWLNSGPAAATLGNGTYFFVVLVPSTQATPNDSTSNTKNLSFQAGDKWTNREFTVTGATVTYLGSHARDKANTRIQLMPFNNTTNTGGEYVLDLCRVPSTPTTGTGAPGAASSTCKKDNFKVATPTLDTPTIATTATTSVNVGGTISDTAQMSGGYTPVTGKVTFGLFTTSACATPATGFTTTGQPITTTSEKAISPMYTATTATTYFWTATYSGDANNRAVTEPCGSTNETSVVKMVTPSISTVATPTTPVGGAISDTATLAGGYHPTGTVMFQLYTTRTCKTAAPTFTTAGQAVNTTGKATSVSYTTKSAETYYWTASYSGDTNNTSVSETCGGTTESSTATMVKPTLVTHAVGTVTVGGKIHDTATLSNGYDPTGTITFTLYKTSSCKSEVDAFSTTGVTVTHGNGSYASATFTSTAADVTYYWGAVYSGDKNNTPAAGACTAATEHSTVTKASPSIVTNATPSTTVGSMISDTATLSGGYDPTGTITFKVYSTSACKMGTLIASKQVTVKSTTTTYPSGPVRVPGAGTYYWTAKYSGDSNNNSASEPCGSLNETTTVNPATPTLSTKATGSVTVGAAISDTATLTGGYDPTGTITFSLYKTSCSTPVSAFVTSGATVTSANGTATSATYTTTAAGTYYWAATYSGDSNNTGTTEHCTTSTATETTTVKKVGPKLSTKASGPVTVSGSISDTATLSGGYAPTSGTVTFALFTTASCTTPAPGFSTAGQPVTTTTGMAKSTTYPTTAAGTYYWTAKYSGNTNNAGAVEKCGGTHESSTVNPATPTLSTKATGSVTVGAAISDTATLTGGYDPTGTITFSLYKTSCSTPVSAFVTSGATVTSANGTATSATYTTTAAGTYYWAATYSGDSNNTGTTEHCATSTATETTTVKKATTSIRTKAVGSAKVGSPIHDTATLSGGYAPTGKITFTLFTTSFCKASATGFKTTGAKVNGDGTYPSATFTPTKQGTYYWKATYSGDSNNKGATGGCNSDTEHSTVTKYTPSIVTTASTTGTVKSAVSDTATLSGGHAPTGTITFQLYDTSSCTTSGLVASTHATVTKGNGTYSSGPVSVPAVGTYYWVATYTGDSNNNSVSETCGGKTETSVVKPATPSLATTASSSPLTPVTVGSTIHDTAMLSGAFKPGGTITFSLYMTSCSTSTLVTTFTTPGVPVSKNGTYHSATYTTTRAGQYHWAATYSGDSNNSTATETCDVETAAETSFVKQADPTLSTTSTPTATLGGTISDTATLTGGYTPTGTITFTLYKTSCSTPVASFTTHTGNGATVTNASATSATYTVTSAGTYYWAAVYSGDTNNSATTAHETCTATNATETSTVTPAVPAITTTAQSSGTSVVLGATIHDVATLSGGYTPTGTITFSLFKTSCTNLVTTFTTTGATVTGNGKYSSATFTTTAAGTYYWAAAYSGDANNTGAASPCGALFESVIVKTTKPHTSGRPLLSVVKSSTPASGSQVTRTQTVTYTLTLSNAGAAPASQVTVTDSVPTGTTYKATSASCNSLSGCSVSESGGKITWTGITVPAGTSVSVSFEVVVDATDTNGQVIDNHATFTNENTPTCTGTTCTTNTVTVHVHVPTPQPPPKITAATTVHTGEPWAGSLPAELGVLGAGFGLFAIGEWLRRRRRPRHA